MVLKFKSLFREFSSPLQLSNKNCSYLFTTQARAHAVLPSKKLNMSQLWMRIQSFSSKLCSSLEDYFLVPFLFYFILFWALLEVWFISTKWITVHSLEGHNEARIFFYNVKFSFKVWLMSKSSKISAKTTFILLLFHSLFLLLVLSNNWSVAY